MKKIELAKKSRKCKHFLPKFSKKTDFTVSKN